MARKKSDPGKPSTAWQGTYGDMITLMLCFFVMLYDPSDADAVMMAAMQASIQNTLQGGGQSLSAGRLSDLGNTVSSLPSNERGSSLGPAKKKAISIFEPDIKSNRITITSDERGLVISLASDSFFEKGSADLNMETTRETLLRLSQFFNEINEKDALEKRNRKENEPWRYRIEGHTDSEDVGPNEEGVQEFKTNWELSAARAANVLHYLVDFGANEKSFSIAGYADTRPKFKDAEMPEAAAYNRRVDIIILDDGHF
ncbi:MAG: flagellar motor protein MotB [Treponema sp.]|nr:flagellar motor protein MotB [Treponema sp.]